MAGNYADVPGPRLAYHRDGTVGFVITSGTVTPLSAGQLQNMNDESSATTLVWENNHYLPERTYGLIFPELRDIVGFTIAAYGSSGASSMQTSPNTTNGQDGTWSNVTPTWTNGATGNTSVPGYRTAIQTCTWNGIKGVRFTLNTTGTLGWHQFAGWHLYGTPSSGQTRWLMFTDTGGTEVGGAYFDFGDDPRGGTPEVRQFRVKNGHGTMTASTITVSRQVLTEKAPIFADDYEFSTDGTTYAASISVGNLAPGASTGNLHVRRTTPIGAQLGLETGIITAAAASWS